MRLIFVLSLLVVVAFSAYGYGDTSSDSSDGGYGGADEEVAPPPPSSGVEGCPEEMRTGKRPKCGPGKHKCDPKNDNGSKQCFKSRGCVEGALCMDCKCVHGIRLFSSARLQSAKPEEAQMSTTEAMEWGGFYAVVAMSIGFGVGLTCMYAIDRSKKGVNPELQASWKKLEA